MVDEAALLIEEIRPSLPEEPPALEGDPSLVTRRLVLQQLIKDKPGALLEKKLRRSFNVYDPDEHSNVSFDYRRKIIEMKRTVLVNYLFSWMLKAAGNQPRDIQNTYSPQTKMTLSAEAVKANLSGLLGVLAHLNNYSPPLIYTLIDNLLTHPSTGLPFNATIPF
jgi:hypothetical protein